MDAKSRHDWSESAGSIILYTHNSNTPNRLQATEPWMLFCVGLDVYIVIWNWILFVEEYIEKESEFTSQTAIAPETEYYYLSVQWLCFGNNFIWV